MRLVQRVERAEAGAADLARRRKHPEGGVWTETEERVDREKLERGEHVAADVYVIGETGGARLWRIRERVTRQAGDLGVLYSVGPHPRPIGRVTRMEGNLIEFVDEENPGAMVADWDA